MNCFDFCESWFLYICRLEREREIFGDIIGMKGNDSFIQILFKIFLRAEISPEILKFRRCTMENADAAMEFTIKFIRYTVN